MRRIRRGGSSACVGLWRRRGRTRLGSTRRESGCVLDYKYHRGGRDGRDHGDHAHRDRDHDHDDRDHSDHDYDDCDHSDRDHDDRGGLDGCGVHAVPKAKNPRLHQRVGRNGEVVCYC